MISKNQPNKFESSSPDDRRGAIVILVSLMIIVFLASVAFSLDVSYMQLTKAQLRSATDAAARAAGEGLSRVQDIEYARQAAKDIALANSVAGKPLVLDDSDVVFGHSDQLFNGAWDFTPGGAPINSVQVSGRRTRDAPSGSVPLFFGKVFSVFDFEPVQSAKVVRLDRDICLVVDRSSSMKLFLSDSAPTMSTGDSRFCQSPNMSLSRWGALSVAVQRFIDALEVTPQIEHMALVSYASNPIGGYCGYWSQAAIDTPVTENHTYVTAGMQSLSNVAFNGATNIEAGILKGIEALTSEQSRPYAAKTMVLMSDGAYTRGEQPSLVAPQAAAADIIIHTITFGEANPTEMQAIADATGGNHYIAPDAETLQDIFEEIALTLPVIFTD